MIPRGIRNNNPGNIRKGAPWQGLSREQPDEAFCTFETPKYGIRAICVTLITYQDKRRAKDGSKIDTIREIIERWAPATENDTEAYIAHASKLANIGADDEEDIRKYEVMKPVVLAIIQHECGAQPYDSKIIDDGLRSAGVDVPVAPLSASRTIKAGTVATVASAATAVEQLDTVKSTLVELVPYWKYAAMAIAIVSIVSIGIMLWARIDDHVRANR